MKTPSLTYAQPTCHKLVIITTKQIAIYEWNKVLTITKKLAYSSIRAQVIHQKYSY